MDSNYCSGPHSDAKSYIRLSAGRESLTDSDQALAFMAGANSIFSGENC